MVEAVADRGAEPSRPRRLRVSHPFSLARTCAPVVWGGNRWPNTGWHGGVLTWVGREGTGVVWRRVSQLDGDYLLVEGTAEPERDAGWATAVLGVGQRCPPFADPVVEHLRRTLPGLCPFAAGSVFDGLVAAIVGQSISVAAAAVTEGRLARLFHPGLELDGRRYWPMPRPDLLAEAAPVLVHSSGVTWRRAEALVTAARVAAAGDLPSREAAIDDPAAARARLRALPLVGPWTVESTLLWGIGLADAHPTGDVALLRAARGAYGEPALDLKGLDRRADEWRPARGWAARLLWTGLLGEAR